MMKIMKGERRGIYSVKKKRKRTLSKKGKTWKYKFSVRFLLFIISRDMTGHDGLW
jgi:hypothetical protein